MTAPRLVDQLAAALERIEPRGYLSCSRHPPCGECVLCSDSRAIHEALAAYRAQPVEAPERRFPIQSDRGAAPHPTSIPWSIADLAYSVYRARHGSEQSLERLAERGGFGANEMDALLPGWRQRSDTVANLATLRADLDAERERRRQLCRLVATSITRSPGTPESIKASWIANQAREAGLWLDPEPTGGGQ